jgi:predicted Rossmann fold nucleotide-binding protein DprA/Smf involved in DNA uptake
VTCAGDVLETFGLESATPIEVQVGANADALLARLRDGPLTGDELVRASGIDPGLVSGALMELELARLVALDDGVYRAVL